MLNLNTPLKWASKIQELPVLSKLSPAVDVEFSKVQKAGFLASQQLALTTAVEIAGLIQEGWTEIETAKLFETALRDQGVQSFFHKPFVWFGEHTRFDGYKKYKDFQPSPRRVKTGDAIILDAAPIYRGYISDIGYSCSLGENKDVEKAKLFLKELKAQIPEIFNSARSGSEVWQIIEETILRAGYQNIHKLYPMSVLGHRVHESREEGSLLTHLHFGWQSYWTLLSRGVFGQLLSPNYEGNLKGLWAIEPHIGADDFGAKFEEILVVDDQGARWLAQDKE